MTARRTEKIFPSADTDQNPSSETKITCANQRRVLSVSPDQKGLDMPSQPVFGTNLPGKEAVFISPRIIDQNAFDELTSDSARTRVMLILTVQGADESSARIPTTGVYHDRWTKTREGWRLAYRALRAGF